MASSSIHGSEGRALVLLRTGENSRDRPTPTGRPCQIHRMTKPIPAIITYIVIAIIIIHESVQLALVLANL